MNDCAAVSVLVCGLVMLADDAEVRVVAAAAAAAVAAELSLAPRVQRLKDSILCRGIPAHVRVCKRVWVSRWGGGKWEAYKQNKGAWPILLKKNEPEQSHEPVTACVLVHVWCVRGGGGVC